MSIEAAAEISAKVRAGELSPVEAVSAALSRIEQAEPKLGAFVTVRREAALAEAWTLAKRLDLAELPLAGVPVAVKDNVDVTGESARFGSAAWDPPPAGADHLVVARLRAAGAVVVGLTTLPELGLWSHTDAPGAITRNPWDLSRSPGGSSGGSGAAVGAGVVPIALGNDGGGSLRIPAASCGIFTIKPGRDVVPGFPMDQGWGEIAENGPMATTVADGALMLSVLADRPELAAPAEPGRLRIGVALASPTPGLRVDQAWTATAAATAEVLRAAGHTVIPVKLPYPVTPIALMSRAFAAAALGAEAMRWDELQGRTKTQARLGRRVLQLGLVRERDLIRVRAAMTGAFEGLDAVITPTLAANPVPAREWSARSWGVNILKSLSQAVFTNVWNVAGWPAASVPSGLHPQTKTPLATQLIAPPGGEAVLLGLATQIEAAAPWPRVAPAFAQ